MKYPSRRRQGAVELGRPEGHVRSSAKSWTPPAVRHRILPITRERPEGIFHCFHVFTNFCYLTGDFVQIIIDWSATTAVDLVVANLAFSLREPAASSSISN